MRHAMLVLFVTGCVWSPADQTSWQSRWAIDVTGYASAPDTVMHIRAFNHRLGRLVEVASANPDDTVIFHQPDMYYWERRITLGRDYWIPPSFPCTSSGMAQIRVFAGSDTQSLPTFTAGAQDCVVDEMSLGTHPSRAGYDCTTGDAVVLFDHDGVCD